MWDPDFLCDWRDNGTAKRRRMGMDCYYNYQPSRTNLSQDLFELSHSEVTRLSKSNLDRESFMFPNFHNTTRDSIWNRVFPISSQNHNSDAWNRNSRIIPGTRSDQHRKHARPNLNFSLFSECKEVQREKVLGKFAGTAPKINGINFSNSRNL